MSAVLLIAVPLLAAFLSILAKKIAPYLLLATVLFDIVILFFLPAGFVIIGGFIQPLGINLLFDAFAKIALFLVNGLVLVIAFLNRKEFGGFSSIMLVAVAGLNGLVLTNDLFNLFVFLEIAGIAAYLIAATNKKPVHTFHYLVLGAIGSSLFLFGLIILYAMFGTLNMVGMIEKIQAHGNYPDLILPFVLMFIGLGVEAKLLPFNSWVKGVLGQSNTLSGPMIASVYAGAIAFVFGRLINNLFQFEGSLLTVVLVILAAGIVIGEMMAFAATKAREILLFSAVAQASLIALLFVNGVVIWAVFLIVANALSKTVMFLVINKAAADTGTDDVNALQGLFAKNILVGIAFTVAALSVMGMPLLVGFIVKLNFLTALAAGNQIALVAVILLASLVEGIYFVRLLIKLWYRGDKEVTVHYGLSFKIVFVVIALALLVFGTYSAPLNSLDNGVDTIAEVINNG
ncbi:MAG: proton-conducting transporter membrane subunit [bacterium]